VFITENKEHRLITQNFFDILEQNPAEINKKIAQSQNFMNAVRELIELCGDDPDRDGLEETPYRVLKAFL
jgi:GTP cyclohydrolase I